MEVGPAGVPGLAVINAVVADAPYAPARAPALRLRTGAKSVKEKRTRSNRATPNPVVRPPPPTHSLTYTVFFACSNAY